MKCPICRDKENWKNVDQYRIKPEGMTLCGNCGFVTYPEMYKTKAEIIEYYKEEYRAPPTVNNIYSGQRKLHYHAAFLDELFIKWKDEGRKDIVVTDIGAAFGMFLRFVNDHFPEANINGVEITKSFVRNAYHMYGYEFTDDFDDTKKYDLISSYKSLEHILDPDVELKRYIDCLKDDGLLYLSVPIWFRTLSNFGASGFDIEYYYHTNHINVWNLDQFEALIGICGGEIVKANHELYESTYFIKKSEKPALDRKTAYQNIDEIENNLSKVFSAFESYSVADFDKALSIWPNFPHAHLARYENNRKKINEFDFNQIYENICEFAIKSCPQEADMQYLAGDICLRYNDYYKAIEHFQKALSMRPHSPNVIAGIANAHRTLAKRAKKGEDVIKHLEMSRDTSKLLKEVSAQNFGEAMTWIMSDNSKIPVPNEG